MTSIAQCGKDMRSTQRRRDERSQVETTVSETMVKVFPVFRPSWQARRNHCPRDADE